MVSKPNQKRELIQLLKISGPLALYYLAEVAMGITDMFIVGRLGSDELAAVGLAGGVVLEFLLICFGILSIVSVLSAEALGRGFQKRITVNVVQGFWVALLLTALGTYLVFQLPALFVWTRQEPQIVELSRDYLSTLVWFLFPALGFVVLRNFLTVLSRASIVALITLPAIGLNLLFNYTLVFGKFGFPAMGVAGAGLGTTLVTLIMFLALITYVMLSTEPRSYGILKSLGSIDWSVCFRIFKLGLPVGGTVALEGGLFAVVAILMGMLSADWLAANEILYSVLQIGLVLAIALGEGAAVRIAYQLGKGNALMADWIGWRVFMIGTIIMSVGALVLWFLPHYLVALFLDIDSPDNIDVLEKAILLAGVAALFQIFDGFQAMATWALRGLKDTFVPMWIAAGGYWICGLGGGCLLCFVFGLGALGLWWGLALGLMVTGSLLSIRFYIKIKGVVATSKAASFA